MLIDLHRHHGGSISCETVWAIIQSQPELKNLATGIDHLYELMTFRGDTKYNFHRFLAKFRILDNIRWTEDAIDLSINQVVSDLKKEGIKYCELRFSINKYLSHLNWDETEACLFFLERLEHWEREYNIDVGPILSIKHESPKVESIRISKLINHWRIGDKMVGIDCVGNEALFDSKFLAQCYRFWRMCGKGLLIHAGESQTAENVRKAILDLKVNRVAHGIRVPAEAPDIMELANDNGVAFDISITSNQMTGVVSDIANHPIKSFIKAGCSITIGTDDPVQLNTTIEKEYALVADILKVDIDSNAIRKLKKNSHTHALKQFQYSTNI